MNMKHEHDHERGPTCCCVYASRAAHTAPPMISRPPPPALTTGDVIHYAADKKSAQNARTNVMAEQYWTDGTVTDAAYWVTVIASESVEVP